MKAYEDLKWRGLIQDISSPDLEEKLNNEKLTFYRNRSNRRFNAHWTFLIIPNSIASKKIWS